MNAHHSTKEADVGGKKRFEKTKRSGNKAKTKKGAPSFQFPFGPPPRAKTLNLDSASYAIEKRDDVATKRFSLVEVSQMNIKEQWKSTSIEESEICDFESETAWEDDGSEAVSGGGCNHKTQFSDDASSYTRRDYSINNFDTETTWNEDGSEVSSVDGSYLEEVSRSTGAPHQTRGYTKSFHTGVILKHPSEDDDGTVDLPVGFGGCSLYDLPTTSISRSASRNAIEESEICDFESEAAWKEDESDSDTETTWGKYGTEVPSEGGSGLEEVSRSIGATRQTRGDTKSLHADVIPEHPLRDDDGSVECSVYDMPTRKDSDGVCQMNLKNPGKSTSIEESETFDFESEAAWKEDGTEAVSIGGREVLAVGGCYHMVQFNDDASSYTKRDLSVNNFDTETSWGDDGTDVPSEGGSCMKEVSRSSGATGQSTGGTQSNHGDVIREHSSRDGDGTVDCPVNDMPNKMPFHSTSCGNIFEEEFSNVEQIEVEHLTSMNHATRDNDSPINESKTATAYPSTNFKRGRRRHGRLHQSFQASLQRTENKSRVTVQSSKFAQTIQEKNGVQRVSDKMSSHINSKTVARNVAPTDNSEIDGVVATLCDTSKGKKVESKEVDHLPSEGNVSPPTESKTNGVKANTIWGLGTSHRNAAPTYPSRGLKRGRRRHGSLRQSFLTSLQKTVPKSRATVKSVKLERIMEETNDIHRDSEEMSSHDNSEYEAHNVAPTNNSKTDGVVVDPIWELGTSEVANPCDIGPNGATVGGDYAPIAEYGNFCPGGVVAGNDLIPFSKYTGGDCAPIAKYGNICPGGVIAGNDFMPFTKFIGGDDALVAKCGNICPGGVIAGNDFIPFTTLGGTAAEAKSVPSTFETSSKNSKILERFEV